MMRRIRWKTTPGPRIKDKAGHGQSGRVPASTIINFSALILLFAAVFGLEHLWQRIQGTRPHEAAVSAEVELPADKEIQRDDGFVIDERAAAVKEPQAVEKPEAVEEPVALAQVPEAPEAEQKVNDQWPEKQDAVEEAAKPKRLAEKIRTKSWARRAIESRVSVEDLDSEAARLGYLSENKRLSGLGTREGAAGPGALAASNPRGDFIPFEQGSIR